MSINACDINNRKFDQYNKFSPETGLKEQDLVEALKLRSQEFSSKGKLDKKDFIKFFQKEFGFFGKEFLYVADGIGNKNGEFDKEDITAVIKVGEKSGIAECGDLSSDGCELNAAISVAANTLYVFMTAGVTGMKMGAHGGPVTMNSEVFKKIYQQGISREDYCLVQNLLEMAEKNKQKPLNSEPKQRPGAKAPSSDKVLDRLLNEPGEVN